jgi:hypothetical protein
MFPWLMFGIGVLGIVFFTTHAIRALRSRRQIEQLIDDFRQERLEYELTTDWLLKSPSEGWEVDLSDLENSVIVHAGDIPRNIAPKYLHVVIEGERTFLLAVKERQLLLLRELDVKGNRFGTVAGPLSEVLAHWIRFEYRAGTGEFDEVKQA